MRENCLQEFESHWKCLDVNNMVRRSSTGTFYRAECFDAQRFQRCRAPERLLNKCMFEKLVSVALVVLPSVYMLMLAQLQGLTKVIPGTPQGQTPIHEVKDPIYTR